MFELPSCVGRSATVPAVRRESAEPAASGRLLYNGFNATESAAVPPVDVRNSSDDPLDDLIDHEYHAECEDEDDSDIPTLEEVRAILSKIPGSLTADFIAERDER